MTETTEHAEQTLTRLITAATDAATHAYAPYSGFRVGAAILLDAGHIVGQIVTGTNVENASYGLTLCAERAALVRAIAEFGPQIRVHAVAVTNLNQAASPPCGACRQVLAEFCSPDTTITFPVLSPTTGLVEPHTCLFRELFPYTFNLPESRG